MKMSISNSSLHHKLNSISDVSGEEEELEARDGLARDQMPAVAVAQDAHRRETPGKSVRVSQQNT